MQIGCLRSVTALGKRTGRGARAVGQAPTDSPGTGMPCAGYRKAARKIDAGPAAPGTWQGWLRANGSPVQLSWGGWRGPGCPMRACRLGAAVRNGPLPPSGPLQGPQPHRLTPRLGFVDIDGSPRGRQVERALAGRCKTWFSRTDAAGSKAVGRLPEAGVMANIDVMLV